MELSAVGERVFAAESIIKRRIRKVSVNCSVAVFSANVELTKQRCILNTAVYLAS